MIAIKLFLCIPKYMGDWTGKEKLFMVCLGNRRKKTEYLHINQLTKLRILESSKA